jgi:hypothetical protein
MLQRDLVPQLYVITVLVSFRQSEVAVSYLGMKTGRCTKLRKVLATHRYMKVGGEFEYCLQSVQSRAYRQFSVQTFK